jgi:ribulose 1,5-bisphosphate synthetase/thiazole synthase
MGRPTAGEAGLTAESRLSSGRYLRVATAEVVSAAGDKWLGIPVQPDIVVVDDRAREAAALEQGYLQGAATVIREVAVRRQTNEASLVREENVEIEEMIAAQKEQAGTGPAPEIRDLTLQRAVDVVRGILASLTPPEIPAP